MEDRKILVVTGSPRVEGNSAILIEQLEAGAKEAGGSVEVIRLHDMSIRPCSACRACKEADGADCVIDDDMRQLYPKLRATTALVIVSPIYWWSLAAQTKLFIDRCDALDGPSGNVLSSKMMGVLLVYGGDDAVSSGAVNAIRSLQDAFNYLDIDVVGFAYGSAWEAGSVRSNERLMKQAYDLGKRIAEQLH